MDKPQDYVGTGDPRLDEADQLGGASMPGTPGYESEAAFRHRNFNEADVPEIRSIQLAPGPLYEVDEPEVQPEQQRFGQETKHNAK